MTEKLYYKDAYLKEFESVITDIKYSDNATKKDNITNKDNTANTDTIKAVALSATAFYPEGGGQGADAGVLEIYGYGEYAVTDVQEEDGIIWHYITEKQSEKDSLLNTAPEINRNIAGKSIAGTKVIGCIDWERRFDHMQQHSGEHIVSGMICSAFNCNNVGFHLGDEIVTIDFDSRISMEQAIAIENRANEYIWQDHAVVEAWPAPEELPGIRYRSKKELEGDVRLISFPGADTCACCGTHVSGSAQIGMVKFLSAKNFHEGTRLELLCGKRAVRYLSDVYAKAKEAAVMLSTSEDNLAEFTGKILQENLRLKTKISSLQEQMFETQAASCRTMENVLVIRDDITGVQARKLAELISKECSGTAAVFAKAGDKNRSDSPAYNYALISKNGSLNPSAGEVNEALTGKGGGKGSFAQGSVLADENAIISYFSTFQFSLVS